MSKTGPIRLVISDVDGTLVNHDKQLAQEVKDAVARLRATGTPFTLVSARCPLGIAPLVQALGLDGPIAAYNGGVITDSDGQVTERHLVPEKVARGMLALATESGVDAWLFADGIWHAEHDRNPHVSRERVSANQEPTITHDLAALADRTEKLTFVSDDPGALPRLTEAGRARFGAQATIAQSQDYYLDVTALAANKGDGVTALARAYGIDLADTAVLGDQFNDVPMFECAGFAVAMGQAPDEVKAKADEISTSNEENGVAVAIDRYILPRVAAAA